jgi:hypothetical protein
MRKGALGVALLTLLAPYTRRAAAQQQPLTIPTDLVIALLDRGEGIAGNRSPKLLVGRAPQGVPGSLTSVDGARILGGIEEGRGETVVLGLTRPPNQVMVSFDRLLATRGWAPPPPPPNDRGGFVSTNYSGGWANTYCADSGLATVFYIPAPAGGTYVKVEHRADKERTICSRPLVVRAFREPTLKFPRLVAPPGMTQQGGGGGSSGDDVEISARLTGGLEPAAIVAHYLKQLDSAGWKMAPIATSGGTTVAAADVKDSEGTQWTGAIIASRVAPTQIDVVLRMARLQQR